MNKRTAILAALVASATAHADDVYLCKKDGKTIYTQSPKNGDCRRLDLKITEPSPEELARQRAEQRRQEAQRQAEDEQDREERRLRAQEATAEAAQRQARAAEAQARYQRDLLRAREDEERNTIYGNVPFFFVSPALRQRQFQPIQPSRPNIDIHIGRTPHPDQHRESAAPPPEDSRWRVTPPSPP